MFTDRVSTLTNTIYNNPLFLIQNNRINPAARRSIFINAASAVFEVIENAVAVSVFQLSVTSAVIADKAVLAEAYFFETFNVFLAEKHFSFGAAYSAV